MAKYLNATRALMMGKATINTDGLFDDDEDDGEEERKKSPTSRWAKLRAFVTKKADHTKKTKRSAAALLEVFRQAIEERNVLFENKSHEVEDSEEVISVIDLWNILEGMGTFLTGAEIDEFMEEQLTLLQKRRDEKLVQQSLEENARKPRRSTFLGFAFNAITKRKISMVAPENDDNKTSLPPNEKLRPSVMKEMLKKVRRNTNLSKAAIRQREIRRGSTHRRRRTIESSSPKNTKSLFRKKQNEQTKDYSNTEGKNDAFLTKLEVLLILNHFIDKVDNRKHRTTLDIDFCQGTAIAARQDPFTVPSDAYWRVNWDLFTMMLIIYVAIMQPFRFGFDYVSPVGSFMYYFETTLDFVFMFDLCLNFRTGYINSRGKMELRGGKIAMRYLKGNFLIDLISSVPWDVVLGLFTGGNSAFAENTRALKAIRLIKLSKLGRLARVKKIIEQIEDIIQVDPELKNVLMATVVMVFIAHLLACVWGAISRFNEYGIYEDSWYVTLNVQDEDMMTQYVYAFYWSVTTVTTVGYGDIGPANTAEMMYACASMVLAGCFYAYVVATISSYFLSTDAHISQFNANMKRLKGYMKHREFPIALERQVKSYFSHFYKNQFTSFDEMQMIRQLPHTLGEDVASFLSKTILSRHFCFSGVDKKEIAVILNVLKPRRAEAGVFLVRIGERVKEMYLVKRGVICMTDNKHKVCGEFRDHTTLCEYAVVPKLVKRHYYNAVAYAPTEFFAMSRFDLEKAMGKRESALQRIRSNVEVLETSRGLTGVSFVVDPKKQNKIMTPASDEAFGNHVPNLLMDRESRVSVASVVNRAFSNVSIPTRITKATKTNIPMGLSECKEEEEEEDAKDDDKNESSDDDDIDEENTAVVSTDLSNVNSRLGRIEKKLERLLSR